MSKSMVEENISCEMDRVVVEVILVIKAAPKLKVRVAASVEIVSNLETSGLITVVVVD